MTRNSGKDLNAADPLRKEIQGEAANALGITGYRLREAMQALAAFDASAGSRVSEDAEPARTQLLHRAAELLWSYVIQKEMLGAVDHALVTRVFGITPEVWRLMGVVHPKPR